MKENEKDLVSSKFCLLVLLCLVGGVGW
jgi:hypothetical protein